MKSPAEREARSLANRKIGFIGHYLVFASTLALLCFVASLKAAGIVGLAWGIGLICHGYFAVAAPMLRRRFLAAAAAPADQRDREERRHARSLEELSASIAHEIRNPITAARSLVAQMAEDPASPENVEYARVALEELDRVERSIAHLLRFARDEEVAIEDTRMSEVIDSALETFKDRLAKIGVIVHREIDEGGVLRADPEKLRRVVINLVQNALDAMEEASVQEPRIEIAAGENLARTEVWLRVRDNGPGIPKERLVRIFTPFFTSKKSGTGLGLAISKKVVEAHGGTLEARSDAGKGTEFTVVIPRRLQAGELR